MARKDQRKQTEVPVGGNLSQPLNTDDIAEREAEAKKDNGMPDEKAGEIPAAETPKEEAVKKPSLFGGKRVEESPPPPTPDAPLLADTITIDDDLDDLSIEDEIAAAEKGEIEYERDGALKGIIEIARKHAEVAKKNNYGTIASSWQSLTAVAQQVQINSQKPYWTKREKV